jgi:diguanylate cyclase
MPAAPLPLDEETRLLSLRDLGVLDTPPEPEFDALVQAAALVCDVPISLVSLIDSSRQWFKANVGLPGVHETPREAAFCAHAILQEGIFEVPDATADPRFADNPLVAGAPDIRFYAGATLRLADGQHAGTLCVIDRQPRQLTPTQRQILRLLADAATRALETRRQALAFGVSQARFRALSDTAPLGVFATDADGACTYTNDRWQAIYGLSAAESLGHGWSRTLHPLDKAAVFAHWQATAAQKTDFDMEFRLQHDDGKVLHVRSVSRPVIDASGLVTGYVGSVEDVTLRLQREQALRKSEALLNRTGELADVGGWELDLAAGSLVWSDQTCRIHGVEPGHRPNLSEAINFYAPEARPVIQAAVEQAMATGQGWDLELPFVQAGGQRIWVRAVGNAEFEDGKPARLLGAFQDVTLRVQQRQALEVAHERLALATDSGGIGVWDFDVQSGQLSWDPLMARLHGRPAHAMIGGYALWADHLHPEDRAATELAVQAALAGDAVFDGEFRIIWADGSVRHLRSAARVTRDAQGRALRMVGVNWDVTALRELAADLAGQHELLHVTLQSIGDAVITTDARGCVSWLNPAAERMTGWLSTEASGRPLLQVFQIVNQETRQPAENPVTACLQQERKVGLASQTVLISRDGAEFGIEDSAAPIRNARGEVLGAVLVFHDVTEQRRLSGEMSYRATHDALTGLVNRAEFETRLRRVLTKAHEDRSHHALMYIDLDQFKLVNDACGHSVGDQLLQQVAKVLGDTVRARDTLARLGGDEFAVILEHCTTEQAQRVAQQICDRMDDFRFVHDERRFRIGTSIGLVPVDARWANTAVVMQAADTSCYAAKEAGRNRVHAWFDTDAAMQARHGEMQWATRLEQAIDENRFVLFAQKIQDLRSSATGMHAEVLLRLRDSDGSLIPPGAFLPAAERFHLASRVDRWVLQHALAALAAVADLTCIDLLSINLSGQSIGDRAFHRHAVESLKAAGAAVCRRVCLEVTETAAVTNLTDAALFIEQVRALGVRIALDDFGAGASSFGYLKTLKVDLLKIDGQFIKDLIDDPLDDAAVRCFVDVARVVGVKTVAEFVDRPEVLQRVREIGIDYAQGFLLHRPEPIETALSVARTALAR